MFYTYLLINIIGVTSVLVHRRNLDNKTTHEKGGNITMDITVTLTCTFPLFVHVYDPENQKGVNA